MTTSLRMRDAADLLKMLTQTTGATTPDNPAEQLSDYVPAPETGSDDVAVTDGLTTPNTPHGPTYTYNTSGVSIYGLAQYS